jgi:hypothetical protein
MKRTAALLAAVATAGALTATTLTATPAAAAACSVTWGSLAKTAAPYGGVLTDLRAGRHTCYDRLVLDLAGPDVGGYTVKYVPHLVQDGSGAVVDLDGGARLEIVAGLPATDADGNRPYVPADRFHAVDVSGFRTFRQVVSLGNFEALEQVGLGVRARLPFRVFELDGPGHGSRLVLDVAHRW